MLMTDFLPSHWNVCSHTTEVCWDKVGVYVLDVDIQEIPWGAVDLIDVLLWVVVVRVARPAKQSVGHRNKRYFPHRACVSCSCCVGPLVLCMLVTLFSTRKLN